MKRATRGGFAMKQATRDVGSTTKGLRAAILAWYRRHQRDLPWRRSRDPYAIWVSEIMLQQTRVETVIPFYERFLERYPTVRDLARAPQHDVLAAWSGLGYYTRAKSLHAAAAVVVREHAGRVPRELEALRALPGIGPYTAAAIASVAHGIPAAAVDGNVIRVLARIAGGRGRRNDPALRREIETIAAGLAQGPAPGDWTQALMELGALVCLPRAPRCDLCPAAAWCVARQSGDPAAWPAPAAAAANPEPRHIVLLLARRRGRVLLVHDKDENAWGLPANDAPKGRAARRVAAELAKTWTPGVPATELYRRFRHRTYAEDLRFQVWEVAGPGQTSPARAPNAPGGHAKWVDPAHLGRLPVRAPTLKALKELHVKRKKG